MDKMQRAQALTRFIAEMQEGYPWKVAAMRAQVQGSQSTAYRLSQAVRRRGEVALLDGRHGHPSKLRGEARTFLEVCCQEAPHTPSSPLQMALRERFDLQMSVRKTQPCPSRTWRDQPFQALTTRKKQEQQEFLRHSQSG
jgi:transposase